MDHSLEPLWPQDESLCCHLLQALDLMSWGQGQQPGQVLTIALCALVSQQVAFLMLESHSPPAAQVSRQAEVSTGWFLQSFIVLCPLSLGSLPEGGRAEERKEQGTPFGVCLLL